jgi:tRNA1(Val) A37 N6-methylase TrmN6
MTKGSKAPLAIMPGLILHDHDGKPTAQSDALMNGETRICFG